MVEVSSPKPNGVHFKWKRPKKPTHNTGSSAGGCLITSRNYTSDCREFYFMPQICGGVTSPWILLSPFWTGWGERAPTWPARRRSRTGLTLTSCRLQATEGDKTLVRDSQQDHRRQEWSTWGPWPPTDVAQPGTTLLCTLGFVMLLNCYSIWQQGPHSCLAWLEPTVWWESALWSEMGWVWIPVAQPIGCVWSYVSYRASLDLSFPICKMIVIRNKRVSKYIRGLEQPCMQQVLISASFC